MSFFNDQLGWKFPLNSPQLRWLNEQQDTFSIEMVRDLISELAYAAHMGKSRAFVLLRSEQISLAAQHALLKSLEEPPANTQLVLVTSNPNSLLPTIRSRCLVHDSQTSDEPIADLALPPLIETLLLNPDLVKYHQLIDFANEYKDKERAIQLIQQLLVVLHNQQKIINKNKYIKLQTLLLKTLQGLEANVNVRLALENCFFAIKK